MHFNRESYVYIRGGSRILVWEGHWQGIWGTEAPVGGLEAKPPEARGVRRISFWEGQSPWWGCRGAKPPLKLKAICCETP